MLIQLVLALRHPPPFLQLTAGSRRGKAPLARSAAPPVLTRRRARPVVPENSNLNVQHVNRLPTFNFAPDRRPICVGPWTSYMTSSRQVGSFACGRLSTRSRASRQRWSRASHSAASMSSRCSKESAGSRQRSVLTKAPSSYYAIWICRLTSATSRWTSRYQANPPTTPSSKHSTAASERSV